MSLEDELPVTLPALKHYAAGIANELKKKRLEIKRMEKLDAACWKRIKDMEYELRQRERNNT